LVSIGFWVILSRWYATGSSTVKIFFLPGVQLAEAGVEGGRPDGAGRAAADDQAMRLGEEPADLGDHLGPHAGVFQAGGAGIGRLRGELLRWLLSPLAHLDGGLDDSLAGPGGEEQAFHEGPAREERSGRAGHGSVTPTATPLGRLRVD
jgi:hypothetical protein